MDGSRAQPQAPAQLRPLPGLFWTSSSLERAVADGEPGTVVALVRQAHGLSQGELGVLAGFSQSAISRLEAGGNLGFDIRVLRALGRLLGIPLRLLGLADEPGLPRTSSGGFMFPGADRLAELAGVGRPLLPVDRKSLLDIYMAAVFADPAATSSHDLGERPVDPDIAHRLMVVRRLANEADAVIGPANVATAVGGLIRLVDRMRRGAKPGMRRQLLDIGALYAEFYGWLWEELGDMRAAVAWTERSLQQAQAAEHPELASYVLIRLSQLAESEHDNGKMIAMAEAAQREPGLSVQVRALALQQEARGHAVAGDNSACMRKLDDSWNLSVPETAQSDDEYKVGYYYDVPHMAAQHAACLLELGRPKDAITFYEENGDGQALCRWQQAVHTAKLAQAYADCGDVQQAAKIGERAMVLGDGLGSALVQNELSKLDALRTFPAFAVASESAGQV